MVQQRTHRSHRRSGNRKPNGFERILNSRLFIVLGSIFLLIGLYSTLSSSAGSNGLYNLILSFFAPAADVPVGPEIAGSGLTELLLYFLPAVFVIIGTLIFARNYPTITLPLSILTSIYLIVIQIKISLFNVNFGGCFYPEFYTSVFFLWVPSLLLLANGFIFRKSSLLILTCFYFYISVVLLYQSFFTHLEFFFAFILLFSLLITWVGQKIEKPINHLINFIFAWGFMGLFWLRKFVVNPRTEFLPLFFTFGILFYLLFYFSVLYTSAKKDNPLPRWIHLVITGVNLLAFIGTTYWVLIHYYAPLYLPVFIAAVLLFNLGGIYLIRKYQGATWALPYHYGAMILAGLFLPLLLQQNRLIIFSALLSVLMLGYAHKYKQRSAFWISFASIIVMFVFFLFSWFRGCLPVHFAIHELPDTSVMGYGIVMGLVAAAALGFTSFRLQTSELTFQVKWFSRKKYERLIRIAFLFSIFLTLGWLWFSLSWLFTGSLDYSPVTWFIASSLFFIGVIRYYAGKQSSFKRPVLYLAFFVLFLYPIMVHWNMTIYRSNLILMHEINGWVLFLHYLSLALLIILGWMVVKRIYRQQKKNNNLLHGLEFLTVCYILFLLFSEYNNLTVIFSARQNTTNSAIVEGDPLAFNLFLPYSILIWVVSTWVLIRGMIQNNRFLRNLAIVLFIGMLIKLFAFDFSELSQAARSIVFLLLGLFLIGFAFVYSRLLKGEPIIPEIKRNVK